MKQIKVGELKKHLGAVLKEVHDEAVAYEVISEGLVIARISPVFREDPVPWSDEEIEAWIKADDARRAKYAEEDKGRPPVDAVELLRGHPKNG